MFYEAMRTDGVDEGKALKFYAAVRLFGPSWTLGPGGEVLVFAAIAEPRPQLTFEQVEQSLDVVLLEP